MTQPKQCDCSAVVDDHGRCTRCGEFVLDPDLLKPCDGCGLFVEKPLAYCSDCLVARLGVLR